MGLKVPDIAISMRNGLGAESGVGHDQGGWRSLTGGDDNFCHLDNLLIVPVTFKNDPLSTKSGRLRIING